ncbi:MAG: family 20 glycosylhydrolase [Clostridia bacterium]|nr:family 20 glycosylhydrolase [Clostridia bacterium]
MNHLKSALCLLLCSALLLACAACAVKTPGGQPSATTAAATEGATEIEPYDPNGTLPVSTLRRLLLVGAVSDMARDAAALAAEIYTASGMFAAPLRTEAGRFSDKAAGDLVLIADDTLEAEAFSAVITDTILYLYYAPGSGRGLLYGAQYLLQQMLQSADGTLACGEVHRRPETAERTMMLDCARKQWSVAWVQNLIAQLSWMGFNTLELHMTEEQGMRCNIWRDRAGNAVPDCNGNDFSFLCGGTAVSWNTDYAEDPDVCWSRDDLTEILACAQRFQIDVIPAVDLPCHCRNLIRRAEAAAADGFSFRYQGEAYTIAAGETLSAAGSGSNTLNIASEDARNLSFAVVEAYADFFKAYGCDRFGIGADEVTGSDAAWADYAAAGGGENAFDGCIRYVNTLCALLKGMGYTVRANNDYLFSKSAGIPVDPDLQVCVWQAADSGPGSTQALIDAGRQLFNCVGSYCYYVLRQSGSGVDARDASCDTWDFHHATAQRIYAGCGGGCGFDDCRSPGGWNPSRLWDYNSRQQTTAADKSLAGACFCLWADWAGLDTEENIFFREDDYGLLPRLWASAAKMWDWDAEETCPWAEFQSGLAAIMYSPLTKR